MLESEIIKEHFYKAALWTRGWGGRKSERGNLEVIAMVQWLLPTKSDR